MNSTYFRSSAPTEAERHQNPVEYVLGGLLTILLVALLAVVIVYYRQKRQKGSIEPRNEKSTKLSSSDSRTCHVFIRDLGQQSNLDNKPAVRAKNNQYSHHSELTTSHLAHTYIYGNVVASSNPYVSMVANPGGVIGKVSRHEQSQPESAKSKRQNKSSNYVEMKEMCVAKSSRESYMNVNSGHCPNLGNTKII
ncbi:uncharacterized protein LOC143447498 [Clavelina lepadiformis]|uniref:uncharacterized protein LOC143447498 n=1 Tax=Clavelina lepadiformis TaxID=159417 RepID=UPI004041EEC2